MWVLSFLFLVKGAALTIHLRAASSALLPLFQLPRALCWADRSTSFTFCPHTQYSLVARTYVFLFFSLDQILFSNSFCVRRKAAEVVVGAWTQTSGFFWNGKARLLCSKRTHEEKQTQSGPSLCLYGCNWKRIFNQSSNVTKTNHGDILDSVHTKFEEDSVGL